MRFMTNDDDDNVNIVNIANAQEALMKYCVPLEWWYVNVMSRLLNNVDSVDNLTSSLLNHS